MTKRKAGPGRPPKLTPEVQTKVIEALTLGNYRKTAARFAGISYQTFLDYMKRGAKQKKGPFREFFLSVMAIETLTEVTVVGDLVAKARKDPKLAKWWLAHRHPKRWADNQPRKVELTGKNGGPLQIDDAREVLLQRLERLAKAKAKKPDSDE